MPVLHVRALPQTHPERIENVLKETCMAIAEAYGCEPEQVWATWEEIKPGYYVEGRNSAPTQPDNTHPPIAQLICFEGKSANQIEKVLLVAAKILSEGLGIPNNIFMTYVEASSGRVIAGDGIVRKK
jgi:phenylpyruvate tautomerase PptA (4-oxalocrotonate tautomerase family)